MDFNINYQEDQDKALYHKESMDIAYAFSKDLYKEFGQFLKAIVLFGSTAKRKENKDSDVDILVIVDDLTIKMTPEIIEAYRIIVEKLVKKVSTKIHVTSLKFTTFYEYVHAGDPVAINMLRSGVSLIDTGFFNPLKALLKVGRIRPTPESVWTYYSKAPHIINNSKNHILQAVVDLYWAVIDASHAALMAAGEVPPSPDHVSDYINNTFIKKGKLEQKYGHIVKDFYTIAKSIMHKEVTKMSGVEYDRYLKSATEFVEKMQNIINKTSFKI